MGKALCEGTCGVRKLTDIDELGCRGSCAEAAAARHAMQSACTKTFILPNLR